MESIIFTTGSPIITPATQESHQEGVQTDQYWRLVDGLVAWKRSSLSRSIILLSFAHEFGCQSTLSVKDTMISIVQCICGPLSGSSSEKLSLLPEQTHEKLIVRHGKIESGPHFVLIATDFDVHERKIKMVATIEALHKSGHRINVLVSVLVKGLCCLAHLDTNADCLQHAQVGPVVGWVSPRFAQILLECDEEGQITCIFTDRITGEEVVTGQQTKRRLPVIFAIQHLRPGRIYDVSFLGLQQQHDESTSSISAIVQTPYEPAPSWTLAVVADDNFLDGKVKFGTMGSSEEDTKSEAAGCSSFVSNIASHLLPQTRGMYADVILHIGNTVCLAHELADAYNLYQQHSSDDSDGDRHTIANCEELIRGCVRRHWGALLENRELLSRGAHVFSSLGLLRSLLSMRSDTGVPLSFLLQVQRIVHEYEAVGGAGIDVPSFPAEKYLTQLQHDGVLLLTLDTLENFVTPSAVSSAADSRFAQLQTSMLSTSQWDAIERLLAQSNEKPQVDLKLLVVLCDVPLVWQDTEFNARAIWEKQPKPRISKTSTSNNSSMCAGFANAWSLYPQELERLLQLIFRKKEQVRDITCACLDCTGLSSYAILSCPFVWPEPSVPRLGTLFRSTRESHDHQRGANRTRARPDSRWAHLVVFNKCWSC